jgi:hypothetical protein
VRENTIASIPFISIAEFAQVPSVALARAARTYRYDEIEMLWDAACRNITCKR